VTAFDLTLAALAHRTGRHVRVAVVDSGIHADHPHVGGISGGVAIDALGAMATDLVSLSDRLGHGTAVAAAIREKAPAVELFAVKVFGQTLTATGRALVDAILWAADRRVHIINLSLGTLNQEHAEALSVAVRHATSQGALVVSAAPQVDAAWLPGGLDGVIAVDVDWHCARETCHVSVDDDGRIRLSASGYPRPIPGVAPERNFRGLSFAVANATGLLALALEGYAGPSFSSALEGILRNSMRGSSSTETAPTRHGR